LNASEERASLSTLVEQACFARPYLRIESKEMGWIFIKIEEEKTFLEQNLYPIDGYFINS